MERGLVSLGSGMLGSGKTDSGKLRLMEMGWGKLGLMEPGLERPYHWLDNLHMYVARF